MGKNNNTEKTSDRISSHSSGGRNEQRLDHRHTLALDTEVHFHEQHVEGMFRCRTSNIGLRGAFLPAEHLPIDSTTDIDLVFHATTQPERKKYCMNAKIVHISGDGAGVMFCPVDDQQLTNFRRFLLKAKVAARH